MPEIRTPTTPRRTDTRRVGRGRRAFLALLAAAGVVLVTDAVFGDRGLLELLRARQTVSALETDIARAEARNQQLREDVRRLREDPAAIEALARKELGLIRPGEKLFIIRDVPPPSSRRPR